MPPFLAVCITGQASVVGPAADTVCPAVNSKTFNYRVSSNKTGVAVGKVAVNVTSGVSCTVSPSVNGEVV